MTAGLEQIGASGVLHSVQVGSPQRFPLPVLTASARVATTDATRKRTWRTSFYRTPSAEPRWLFTTHLAGNQQADTKHHGHLNQAVLLYALEHYPRWQAETGIAEFGPGGLGENFTVTTFNETNVCIGDIFALSEARIQVAGPRYPCINIARRWRIADLRARVASTGRTGWYCGVLHEGLITPGMEMQLIERPCPELTMARINAIVHGQPYEPLVAEALMACDLLEPWWKDLIAQSIRQRGAP